MRCSHVPFRIAILGALLLLGWPSGARAQLAALGNAPLDQRDVGPAGQIFADDGSESGATSTWSAASPRSARPGVRAAVAGTSPAVTDLGTLGGPFRNGMGTNEAGQVVATPSTIPRPTDAQARLLQFRSQGHVLGFTPERMYTVGMGYALIEEFVGAHRVQPQAANAPPSPAATSSPTGVPPLQAVTYPHLWDGITLSYTTSPSGLAMSTYRVEPKADPHRIRLRYTTEVTLQADGSLRVQHPTGKGYFTLSAPKAWQEVDGRRVPVQVAFAQADARVVGFTPGTYDPTHPLLIDPTYTAHAFFGSATDDYGYSIAVDGGGNVYVTGSSDATWNGPGGAAPLHAHSGGGAADLVVMKFDSAGTLLWHTFFGSAGSGPWGVDGGYGIAVDATGTVYVTGFSHGAWNGPSGQAPLHAFGGYQDIVVLKLDSAGTYQWHTFYGTSEWSQGSGIALDGSSGAVYVTGTSYSTWGTPLHPHGPNGWDTVVLKLDSAGVLQWNTFAGANGGNWGYAIAVDGSGNVYATGMSQSTWGTPLHPHSGSPRDIFVLKLTGAGAYLWHTLYGAAGSYHEGRGIAVDGSGSVYVTGSSTRTWGTPLNPHNGDGSNDIVVMKFDSAGTLLWHTFYGTSTDDTGYGIAVDGAGSVYVTGGSWGTWGTPLHAYAGYGWDIVVMKLDSAGAYRWHAFYGATATAASDPGDVGLGIARDSDGDLYVSGYSTATWEAPLHPHSGNRDIVVLRLCNGIPEDLIFADGFEARCR